MVRGEAEPLSSRKITMNPFSLNSRLRSRGMYSIIGQAVRMGSRARDSPLRDRNRREETLLLVALFQEDFTAIQSIHPVYKFVGQGQSMISPFKCTIGDKFFPLSWFTEPEKVLRLPMCAAIQGRKGNVCFFVDPHLWMMTALHNMSNCRTLRI